MQLACVIAVEAARAKGQQQLAVTESMVPAALA
jgi:hypothetical protein